VCWSYNNTIFVGSSELKIYTGPYLEQFCHYKIHVSQIIFPVIIQDCLNIHCLQYLEGLVMVPQQYCKTNKFKSLKESEEDTKINEASSLYRNVLGTDLSLAVLRRNVMLK
jgi:hypothetical protein